jgi:hypothetical protein
MRLCCRNHIARTSSTHHKLLKALEIPVCNADPYNSDPMQARLLHHLSLNLQRL